MTDLDKLIEAVEAGDRFGIIPFSQRVLAPNDYSYRHGDMVASAFEGSLDAAKALHDAMLPIEKSNGFTGWSVFLACDYDGDKTAGPEYKATISDGNYHCSCQVYEEATSMHSMARSWLIAILKAYKSTVQE